MHYSFFPEKEGKIPPEIANLSRLERLCVIC